MRFSLTQDNNPIKKKIKEGKLIVGTWVNTLRDPLIIRIIAAAGFDYVFIDMEHAALTEEKLMDMCLIARECGVAPIVRPVNPGNLQQNGRLLDIGASGMIIPHVNTAEETHTIVRSTKFFEGGTRGYCGRTLNNGFQRNTAEDLKKAESEAILVAQFESAEAVAQADEILKVHGIDIAIVGRGDLAHGMGLSGKNSDPRVGAEVDKVIAACKRNGIAPGLLVNDVTEATNWISKGIRCITFSNELNILLNNYENALKDIRAFN
ncbi:MAG: HpcH/HpaI aldolase/citrate lyase family protein [Negativicutes bacterium]